MPDKPIRPQLNIRLDKHLDLLDEIKQAAGDRNTTTSEFVIDAILTTLGKTTTTTPTATPSLEVIMVEVDKHLDTKLAERLGEFERRLLAQFRRDDRQPASEEDRQVREESRQPSQEEDRQDSEEVRPKTRLDYQEIRDRILKSLITGRGRIAPSAPQYKSAVKALDRFIAELEADAKVPPKE